MADKKILIVDDEAAIRTLLRCAVSAPGISVFEADCGAKALAIAAEHAPFALVVSDILMPGMDGIELAKTLLAAGQAQRFLFVSGYCDLESIPNRTRDFPMSAFLAKPFSIPELLGAVRSLVEEQGANGRGASVREQPRRSALRRQAPQTSLEVMRALRGKAGRLRIQRDLLVEDSRWALRTRALLIGQIRAQYAEIQAIQRRVSTRRATL